MSKLAVHYYKSCAIPPVIRGTEIKPFFKIISLHGFHANEHKYADGVFNPLNGISEPKIYYVIAKSQSYLDEIPLVDNWRCTNSLPINGKTFNEDVEISIPYCELYEYCHLVLVLANYFVSSEGHLEERFLYAGYLSLFNNHDVFRRGIYEVELHPLDHTQHKSLNSITEILHKPEFNGKPKSIPELNRLLKMMRKKLRGQLATVPMEKTALSQVESRIHELKRISDCVFICLDFRFTREIAQSLPIVLTRPMQSSEISHKSHHNPVEKKYYSMTRNYRAINTDRIRKPNIDDLNEIKRIIKQPPMCSMTDAESDLIWMYRYYISDVSPTALSKVMRSVKWDYQGLTDQVVDILLKWPDQNPEYLMELLTPDFRSSTVRKFAVRKLNQARNEDLYLYLFQLVQALRYEDFFEVLSVEPGEEKSFDPDLGMMYGSIGLTIDSSIYQQKSILSSISSNKANQLNLQEDLASFLIRRCQSCRNLSSFFFWFLNLEQADDSSNSDETKRVFEHILTRFKAAMERGNMNIRDNGVNINAQVNFVSFLSKLVKTLSQGNHKAAQKTDILRQELLKYSDLETQFTLPLNSDFVVAKIDISSSMVLKSTLAPIKLCLLSPTNETFEVIFKDGDDLRQDQVVLQMINFMDEILRRENFDLRLTPYKVLATSSRSGLIEFVRSKSISEIQSDHITILNYLRKVAPNSSGPNGVDSTVMDTYTRSLAGYCVITYLLGVGDRHLDNIMLSSSGHFFHIDFGFVMGNDPKPLPPEVRLTKDMIDALGGSSDHQFLQFFNLASTTFNYLRRHASQCLGLLSLTSEAGIQHLGRDPTTGRAVACEFVRERFLLDYSDEEAVHHLADRITASVKAVFPEMMERLHRVAMKFK